MDNFKVHVFKQSHMDGFEPQSWQEKEYERFKSDGAALAGYVEGNNAALTIMMNNRVMCFCGALPLYDCGCNVWLMFSKDKSVDNIRSTTKIMRYLFSYLQNIGYLWTQTLIRTDYDKGHRWAKLLGFEDTGEPETHLDDVYTYWKKVF